MLTDADSNGSVAIHPMLGDFVRRRFHLFSLQTHRITLHFNTSNAERLGYGSGEKNDARSKDSSEQRNKILFFPSPTHIPHNRIDLIHEDKHIFNINT